ncbi:hypothetical protein LMJ53_05735 [Rheinheimera sp. UJ51]|nr:hypothetical protein [Rheinheimera sp. UJ51]
MQTKAWSDSRHSYSCFCSLKRLRP